MTHLERVADTRHHTGEGPQWHPSENCLYWVDILSGELYRYDPDAEAHALAYEAPGEHSLGDLYRLDTDASVTTVVEDVDIPNGMGFSNDLETFYFTESNAGCVYAFDYDREAGGVSNRRTFVEVPDGDGVPDGMTVDEDDQIWSARWNGGRAVRYDASGTPVAEIAVPARKVSSVTFAGPEYDDLYLTTALSGGDRGVEGDGAGALFRVSGLETGGASGFRSRIDAE